MERKSLGWMAAYFFGMACLFAWSGATSRPGNAGVPVSLAFTALGMLAGTCNRCMKALEIRLEELERRMEQTPTLPHSTK